MSALRLLYLTRDDHPSFRPDIQDLFGRQLPRLGVRTTLCALAAKDAPWSGGDLLTRPMGSGGRLGRLLAAMRHDLSCVRRHGGGHHVVQVRNKIVSGLLCLALARLRGTAFCYWMSYPYPEDNLLRARIQGLSLGPARWAALLARGLFTRWVLHRLLLPRCDHVFVQSQAMLEALAARGLDRDRMTAVPMGVDADLVGDAPPPPEGPPRPPASVVFLGALDRYRRPDFLLETMRMLRETVPDAHLLCIGDATETADRRWFDERVRAMGLDEAVTVTGWLPRNEAWRLAASARVGLNALPPGYVMDTMSPTKSVELLALGVPMVVSEHPDQGELVRESGGGIVVAYDPEATARALAGILADPDAARAMGSRGKRHVLAHRSYAVIAEGLAGIYADLTPRRETRP